MQPSRIGQRLVHDQSTCQDRERIAALSHSQADWWHQTPLRSQAAYRRWERKLGAAPSAVAVVWGSLETTAPRLQCDGKGKPHSEALPLKKTGELLGI